MKQHEKLLAHYLYHVKFVKRKFENLRPCPQAILLIKALQNLNACRCIAFRCLVHHRISACMQNALNMMTKVPPNLTYYAAASLAGSSGTCLGYFWHHGREFESFFASNTSRYCRFAVTSKGNKTKQSACKESSNSYTNPLSARIATGEQMFSKQISRRMAMWREIKQLIQAWSQCRRK